MVILWLQNLFFTQWPIEIFTAEAATVTGGFEASGQSPEPLHPKRPAGRGRLAKLSK